MPRHKNFGNDREDVVTESNHTGASELFISRTRPRESLPSVNKPRRIPGLAPGPVNVTYNCLLVPVVVAVWWFWFKRKTKRVITRLLHTEPQEEEEFPEYEYNDEAGCPSNFSSWDEVAENETRDSSVQFVRWIKRHREVNSTTHQRASLVQNSRRTLRLAASSPRSIDGLTESILDDEISLEESEPIKWQDLQHEKCLSPTGPFSPADMSGRCSDTSGSACLGDIA